MLSAIFRLWRRGSLEITVEEQAFIGALTAGVPTFRASLSKLAVELRRARRYERPLAILALGPGNPAPLGNGDGSGNSILHLPAPVLTTHMVFFLLGSLLRDSMRETDIVTYAAEHHLYAVMLPEAGELEARGAIDRIARLVYERSEVRLRSGVAVFPRDGLTVEDLFANARKSWKGQVLVGPIPVIKEVSSG